MQGSRRNDVKTSYLADVGYTRVTSLPLIRQPATEAISAEGQVKDDSVHTCRQRASITNSGLMSTAKH
jgi:hypothetical protein